MILGMIDHTFSGEYPTYQTARDRHRREQIMDEFRYRSIMAKPWPTVRELADQVGLASSSTVQVHLAVLIADGRLVQHHATGSRTILLPPLPEPCGECGRR
jgi:hypothetical protein